MYYKNRKKIGKIYSFLAAMMLISGTAWAQDKDPSTIDLGFGMDDDFKMFPDELAGAGSAQKPQISIGSNDAKSGLMTPPTGGIVPKTGAVPGGIVPKTGAVPGGIVPKTGAVPDRIVPKTGAVPGGIVPKTGAVPGGIVPKTGAVPGGIVPKIGAVPGGIVPKTGAVPNEGTLRPQGSLLPPENDIVPIIPRNNNILEEIDDAVFSEMSDIEKQTAVLSLELRREKIKNEIEAIKAQRSKAVDEANAAEEEKRLKKLEWEKQQERKIIEEQIKLKKVDIAFEKLRQEGILKSYKEQMLTEQQKWIDNNANIYERIKQDKKEQEELSANIKDRLTRLVDGMDKANKKAEISSDNHKREITELQTQISILKARLEAEKKTNPFADGQAANKASGEAEQEEEVSRLSDLYIIMEIKGQGTGLAAKLMNRDGQTFLVQDGTVLQTGQKVDQIETTHIRVDKDGIKDYLYFSAGGVLDKEPGFGAANAIEKAEKEKAKSKQTEGGSRSVVSSRGIPGVSRDMMLR